jgi:hypothetical protein
MTHDEILKTIGKWHDAMKECDGQMDRLSELVGPVAESPLGEAVYNMMGNATKVVADLIGWDEDALLDWWSMHNFGERPMKIGFPGEPMREISTIDQLAAFIAEDLQRAS